MMPVLKQEAQQVLEKSFLTRAMVVLGLSLSLCACNSVDRTETSSIPMDDYRIRHPITLSEAPRVLDIFPAGGAGYLDPRSAGQVIEFGQLYREVGEGPIVVLYPAGSGVPGHVPVDAIRRALAMGGAHTVVRAGSYPVTNPALASPVRLSFTGLKAKVATPCGEWPSDLASGSTVQGWDNKPYWNYGCASQAALAAQVADPRDLIGPQGETPTDTLIKARGIETIRKGTDPSTAWATKSTGISTVGSN
jgi:pilus assembly protein CpaD